jgi:hypothetical protein
MKFSPKKFRDKSPQEIQQILADAWLNIIVDENTLYNPLLNMADELIDTPHLYYSWLMSQPDYFSFFVKEILDVEILPIQGLMLKELWQRKFPMLIASRGFGKSFMSAVYAVVRAMFMPGRKIVICGAAYRQSKVIYDYIVGMHSSSAIFRDIVGQKASRNLQDMMKFHIGESTITALPIGDGQKIRGQRGHDLMMDEFASVPREVFENVIAGFAAVSSAPADNVKKEAAERAAKALNISIPTSDSDDKFRSNSIVFSGTAYYSFNHFAEYWTKWRKFVNSRGQEKRLLELFPDGVPEDFNWQDYSIMRIPYELIPKGFMDAGQVARSKATIHSGIYEMEFGAVFSNDSNGFFKRSLVESCVVGPDNEIEFPSGKAMFPAVLRGKPERRYVYGVDPASEEDNFSIVILELHPDHRRVVHCWTTNRNQHKEKIKAKISNETDFYSYCCRKIRDLMKVFPCERIALDSQGGGFAILEGLHDKDKIQEGEDYIWEVIDPDKEKWSDGQSGLHIVEMINFASSDWTQEANDGLRKDFEDKKCLFPHFNIGDLSVAIASDSLTIRDLGLNQEDIDLYDTLDNCVMEIEDLKDELSTIQKSQTPSGRDRWDTPEIKLPGGKKGRQRKDRYSSLIMANTTARRLEQLPAPLPFGEAGGGFAGYAKTGSEDQDYVGPAWFTNKMQGIY